MNFFIGDGIKGVLLIIFKPIILLNSSWWQLLSLGWFLLFFGNLDYLSLDAVVLHFLENSSWVFFKVFLVVSYLFLHFYNSGLSVFLNHLSVTAFVPLLLFFCKEHSDVIDFHNSDLFKLLARTTAINFPEPLFQ